MARSKEFDVDEALDRALDVFWVKGYEAASMGDLQRAMGIGRQSLYDTFGDKRRLFVAALERYNAMHRVRVEDALVTDETGMDALRNWFRGLVDFLAPRGGRRGCLIANSVLEVPEDDAEVHATCADARRFNEQAFGHVLQNARSRGEFEGDVDDAARFLVTQMYGLTVLSRNGATKTQMHRVVDLAFRALTGAGAA
jgi:TetR/AcrR family transcriptional repressor of nem operon